MLQRKTVLAFFSLLRAFLSRFLFLLSLLIPLSAPQAEPVKSSFAGLSMGTLVNVEVWSEGRERGSLIIDRVDDAIARWETLFTVHGEGPLQNVNRNAGRWVAIDCQAAELIRTAREIGELSGGAFEPTIGPLASLWKIGFGADRVPSREEIDEAKKLVDFRGVELSRESGACRVRIREGQKLDLGGIAKGWIGTELVKLIAASGGTNAMIDLGGNVALLGGSPAGREWRIGVQTPGARRGIPFAVITVSDASVITSGDYERRFEHEGKVYGHILDPRTGWPVPADIGSVTIVDADGARADGWCTALFAMGLEGALQFLRDHPGISAFVVDAGLERAWVTAPLEPRLALVDDSIALEVIGPKP